MSTTQVVEIDELAGIFDKDATTGVDASYAQHQSIVCTAPESRDSSSFAAERTNVGLGTGPVGFSAAGCTAIRPNLQINRLDGDGVKGEAAEEAVQIATIYKAGSRSF
eukprot:3811513-Amphidinium_carterae.1